MPISIRPIPLVILWVTSLGFAFALEPNEADAQAAMKRSAGTMNRSSGSRRSNSLGSQTRGHSSGMSESSKSSKPNFRSVVDDDSDLDDDSDYETDEEESDSDSTTGASDDGDEDEDRGADHAHRTLGKACMYGARGEVIFRPAGSRCRGDGPTPAAKPAEKRTHRQRPQAAATREAPSRTAHPGPAAPTRRATTREPSDSRPRGSCIYGPKGRVIHAPAGAHCRRK